MLCGMFTFFTFIEAINSMQVLDPIDGTKGFLKGSEALYVVGVFNLKSCSEVRVISSQLS